MDPVLIATLIFGAIEALGKLKAAHDRAVAGEEPTPEDEAAVEAERQAVRARIAAATGHGPQE